MAVYGWKLVRLWANNEEFLLYDGETSIGRGLDNKIPFINILISRHHAIILVEKDTVKIKDLKSSNGTFVGCKNITPNIYTEVEENSIIGLGCSELTMASIEDNEPYIFKLVKQQNIPPQLPIEKTLKRKANAIEENYKHHTNCSNIINIDISDSDDDELKKIKLELKNECNVEEDIKDKYDIYDDYNIKEDFMEPIVVDSDSDSESQMWIARLSQSSPRKSITRHSSPVSTLESIELPDEIEKEDMSMVECIELPNDTDEEDNKKDDAINDLSNSIEFDDLVYIPLPKSKQYIVIEKENAIKKDIAISKSNPVKKQALEANNAEKKENVIGKKHEKKTKTKEGKTRSKKKSSTDNDKTIIMERESKVKPNKKIMLIEPLAQVSKQKGRGRSKDVINESVPKKKKSHVNSKSAKESIKSPPVTKQPRKVHFSSAPPDVRVFQIEPGHSMKGTKNINRLYKPVFSTDKLFLMKILRWSPDWLHQQFLHNEPPPILGNNVPLTVFHSFETHAQYMQIMGDLMLLEIWDSLSQAFQKLQKEDNHLKLRLETAPLSKDRCFELFNLSVNASILKKESKKAPRVGDLMVISFGEESKKKSRFFYVHNVRTLPSPPNNAYNFYSVSLQAKSSQMAGLQIGEALTGISLAYIKHELGLFEAMEYLACSPLCETILKPTPRNFPRLNYKAVHRQPTQWTEFLNNSQMEAVNCAVNSALSDKPSIQMIQGPPGTGKSSVICSIIMSYFYDVNGQRLPDRGKIMICASSNTAVDGLLCRLLNIRQSLKNRFRMVRVGCNERMHPQAREISLETLTCRDLQRSNRDPPKGGLNEELTFLEAKINMWQASAYEAKDPGRLVLCENRIAQLKQKIQQLRNGGAVSNQLGEPRREDIAFTERRIIDKADIIITTLGSSANYKLLGLKRRIALCIVDEAAQAIEPETLLPLTLDIIHICLVGDPNQLPGFLCSQRAKKHGLNESLLSRLSSCTASWKSKNPLVLLNVQYRMHPEIADYPNRVFYNGLIKNSVNINDMLSLPHYCMISVCSGDNGQDHTGANDLEAWAVSRLAYALSKVLKSLNMSLAIITPYRGHREAIQHRLQVVTENKECNIEVNTVDSFQGQERDVVLVSLARSSGAGFLADPGRINVMLTRARHSLFICLNSAALKNNPQWRTLIDDATNRRVHLSLPKAMCQPISRHQINKDKILSYITNS